MSHLFIFDHISFILGARFRKILLQFIDYIHTCMHDSIDILAKSPSPCWGLDVSLWLGGWGEANIQPVSETFSQNDSFLQGPRETLSVPSVSVMWPNHRDNYLITLARHKAQFPPAPKGSWPKGINHWESS